MSLYVRRAGLRSSVVMRMHGTLALRWRRPTMPVTSKTGARNGCAHQSRYHEVYARAQRDPQGFWADAAQDIDWYPPAKSVFDPAAGVYGRWFVGGVCNTCYNAVDRHVAAGRANQTAIIYDSPVTNTKRTYHLQRAAGGDRDARRGAWKISASARATGSSSTCRWCPRRCSPCSPARASARFIRSCSAASRPRNSPPASTTASRS